MSYRMLKLLGIFLILNISLFWGVKSWAHQSQLYFCADPDWMPFEGIIDGQHQGIAADYAKLLSDKTGYLLTLKATSSWQQSMEFLKSGQCDLVLMLNRSEQREQFLSFTIPYFFGPNVLVTQSGKPFLQDLKALAGQRLGIVSEYRLAESLAKYYPYVKLSFFASEQQGLKALAVGEVDAYVGSLFSINARLQQLGLDDLRINGWISIQDELRIGVIKQQQELVATFNQAIESITVRQHNNIFQRWSNARVVETSDYRLAWFIFAVVMLVLLFVAWRYYLSVMVSKALKDKNQQLESVQRQLQRMNKDLEYLSYHDNLTGLFNRHYFNTGLKKFLLQRQVDQGAVVMLDLDYFKHVNDHYGHATGDRVLKLFADKIKATIREQDIAVRWGGEEFIVFLPNASVDIAEQWAMRFKRLLSGVDFTPVSEVTASVGISVLERQENIEDAIERADQCLYQAKQQGRNCVVKTIE